MRFGGWDAGGGGGWGGGVEGRRFPAELADLVPPGELSAHGFLGSVAGLE